MKTCKSSLHSYEGKQCHECQKLWWAANKDAQKPIKKAYDKANRDRQSKMQKALRDTKRGELRAYFKDYRNKPENKAKRTASQIRRQAKKINRAPKWLTSLQLDHIKLFYETAARMKQETGLQFDVDHIVPLQGKEVSGLHVPWNLQVISHKDNMDKGNKF